MFEHAFQHFGSVWLDIGADNIRSQKASAKLGAVYVNTDSHDLGTGRADEFLCFEVTKAAWDKVRAARG